MGVPTYDKCRINMGTFYEPQENRFEIAAYSYEGVQFLNTRDKINPFKTDPKDLKIKDVKSCRNTDTYRFWCWNWWNGYGRVNGIRGNWSKRRKKWDNNRVKIIHHKNLEKYDVADGVTKSVTQQLEKKFYQDLEQCQFAVFFAHGGNIENHVQMGRGKKGWFAWGVGDHKLGQGNLRHLIMDGCGTLSYFRLRVGRLLTKQWMSGKLVKG